MGGLSSYLQDPPPPRNYRDDHATLLASYWCSGICICAFLFRIFGRYVRIEKLYHDDILMALSVVPLFVRMGFVHVVLRNGTNNVDVEQLRSLFQDGSAGLDWDWGTEEKRRRLGSGMVLGARVALAFYIFMQKYTITTFYHRLIAQLYTRRYRVGLRMLRGYLIFSFIAVFITIFTTCTSADLTRLSPPPADICRTAFPPLIATAALSSFGDVLLALAPLPTILTSTLRLHWFRKIRLVISFSLSLGCAAVSSYRAYITIINHGSQQTRTLWASLEILTATFVANAVVLNSFARDTGEKKIKFKAPTDQEREVILGMRGKIRQREKNPRGKSWELEDDEEDEWERILVAGERGRKMSVSADVELADGWMPVDTARRISGKRGSGESTWEMLERVGTGRTDEGSLGMAPVKRPDKAVLRDVGGLLQPRGV